MTFLASLLCLAFVGLALWHFYMALRPAGSTNGTVPTVDGKPLFVPSRKATAAVAIVLLLFALLVAATSGGVRLGLPPIVLRGASYALALGLLARAIGEFKYVGFFKRVRGSRFATLDTFVFSPLCLVLSVGVGAIAGG
jgi:hypothetical protein